MKISRNWLQDFVDFEMLGISTEELAGVLTRVGLAVELVDKVGDDVVFDLDVTTNRSDCLSHLGVARELAAQFRLPLRKPDFEALEREGEELPGEIDIQDPDLCPRYSARVIDEVTIEESPDWLKKRLEAVGQRPINNLVDITNYVLFEVGHPLHAFDYEKLEERRIVVRRARSRETIRSLDGIERETDPEMLLICDASRPVAIAGVMGGEESEVSPATRTILLESAYFQPASVRRTSKKLGLSTEASYRFERGADPEMPVRALNLASRLIVRLCGGRCAGPVIDANPVPYKAPRLQLRSKRVKQVLGVGLPQEEMVDTLKGLGFEPVPAGEAIEVTVPSFRSDIELEDDLVEEVVRHYGYERLPSSYSASHQVGRYPAKYRHDRIISAVLTDFGFYQALNYSFTSPSTEKSLLGRILPMVGLSNPLTENETHMRTSLLPGLIDSLRRNLNHGREDVRLFEFGQVYHPAENGGRPAEEPRLGFIATGEFHSPFWKQEVEELNFFHVKGMLQTLLGRLGVEAVYEPAEGREFLHPGIAAQIEIEGEQAGFLGELHPELHEEWKFPSKVYFGELSLTRLYLKPLREPRFVAPGRFPSVSRDLSLLVDRGVPYSTINSAVQALDIPDLADFRLIDLYQGHTLSRDKVSLTVRLIFEDPERTLTQEEVGERCEQIVAVLKDRFAVEQR